LVWLQDAQERNCREEQFCAVRMLSDMLANLS
jgi:hypothetical protein